MDVRAAHDDGDALATLRQGRSLAEPLSYRDGARLAGVSLRTFRRIVARGEIPAIKVSPRRVVFRPDDIRAHLERCQVRR
ncbi:helix-turn-helix transcriptional regulator [Pseudoxanthobacter sp. M-2]|uniref:helix-turn-helix transcriptional regulator n=1 Tax=Pseudoxanthobacter sp. M-2 TaxID=3078754 RepID=UPI0038FBFCA5